MGAGFPILQLVEQPKDDSWGQQSNQYLVAAFPTLRWVLGLRCSSLVSNVMFIGAPNHGDVESRVNCPVKPSSWVFDFSSSIRGLLEEL